MAWKPDYITAAKLKAYVRVDDALDDVQVAVAVTTASRAIDNHTNRQFGKVDAPEERFYTAWPDYDRGLWVIDIDDLMSVSGLVVTVDGTTLTSDGYTKEPVNAAAEGKPWTRLAVKSTSSVQPTGADHEIAVVALWGWTTVPVPVEQAAYLQGSRFLSRRESPYGIAGSPDTGSELRLLARVDPDVGVALRDYVRPRAAG